MKALKQLFFNPEIDEDDIIGENITGIPPFLPSKEDKGCKLLGQDEISYMDESNEQIDLDPEVYSINDIVCQTLISSILEYEKNKGTPPKLDLQGEEIGTDDLDTNLLEHFYVSDECGLPYLLYKWNKSYLEGLEHVHPSQKEHYNKVWYQKLNNFLLHHIENFKKVIEIKGEQYFQFEESTSQDKLPRVKIGTKLVKLKPWTEYLSPHILEFVAKSEKYNRVLSGKGATPDRLDDIRAELLKAFIAESQNPFFIKKLEKEKNKLCKEYVRFCYARRHKIKGKPVSPPIMPFWIWHDFWKRRETVFQDTLSEIFNDILLADPHIDLKKITEGTFDKFDVQKENIDDKDLKLIVHDVYIDPEISKLKELVKKQETFRLSNDGPKSEQTNETDKMDAPKPLGYYFKDVISFSKFEDAYKKFNMDNLGTQDYKIYIGQIVKGTVYSVTRDKVVVDIHAFTLATMHLRNYYDSPYDVPM
ncbi:hypothetical protein BEWA_007280 [Theileria equi strain WA]|uniref:S1 motif domain-containing protein n=1 Tax=Theileria equi strain WA TaxID=1537102 RepID=L0B2H4_THEEQ|nr:hypothetical protein BEWA_007280 [Theileria equi strain WA]AFZ81319.1 hypothetical protein BEWA_007280 [Theileria equi strain WA]|eukprot:XP_004830985.1 hypothetical protein BEWA_007280 [Theileria equi strain WA]